MCVTLKVDYNGLKALPQSSTGVSVFVLATSVLYFIPNLGSH